MTDTMRTAPNALRRALAAALFIFAAQGAAPPEAAARPLQIRLATMAPKDSSFHNLLEEMGREWRAATDGEVRLRVFAGGIQGGEGAMVDRMEINQIQAALISGVGLAGIDRAVAGLQQMPLFFRDLEELEAVMEEMAPRLERRIRQGGFVALGWIDSGWVRIFSKQPIRTPDDMRQTRLYTWTRDNPQTELLKGLGFRPVPIDSTQVTPSLQTGLIDTVPLPPFYVLAARIYKVAPHMIDLNYVPLVGALVINEKAWGRIPEQWREDVRGIAREYARRMTLRGREESAEAVRVMREKWGLKVYEPNEEEMEAWRQVALDAYPVIRGTTVPPEIFDEVVETLEAVRAEEGD